MAFIVGLSFYFAGAFALGVVYNLVRRAPLLKAVHFGIIFACAVCIVVAILAVAFDILNITPEPEWNRVPAEPEG